MDVTSAVDILRAVGRVGARWDLAPDILKEIAKGDDGIAGTADDHIPPATVRALRFMLSNGVVIDLVRWIRGWATSANAPDLAPPSAPPSVGTSAFLVVPNVRRWEVTCTELFCQGLLCAVQ